MATLPDVEAANIAQYFQGDVSQFEPEYLQGKLNEVVDQINVRWGTIVSNRLQAQTLPLRLYNAVVVRVAGRVFANPDGYRKENEGGYGYEINPAVASGTLWFTDQDVLDLTGVDPKGTVGPIGTATIGLHTPRWRP